MGKLQILYVDDEPDLRDVAAMSLELDPDIEVRVAASGREALSLLAAEGYRPDAILLDVMMPEMSGPAVMERLRQEERHARTPVIFVTARVQPKEIADLKAQGAVGVVAKPFDPVTFAGDVRALLGAAS